MIFNNLHIEGREGLFRIQVEGEKIFDIAHAGHEGYDMNEALAFPGLINSHEHLEFNNYPCLGKPPYQDYTEWGQDLHSNYSETITNIESIPLDLRLKWGVYRNLLQGFTSVVHHGFIPQHLLQGLSEQLISIHTSAQHLHSVAFEKFWRLKLNNPLALKLPVVMHIGEGLNEKVTGENALVPKWNFFNRKLIAVHGVQMNKEEAGKYLALVWCPATNMFMFGRTAGTGVLKHYTNILFGSDSTLTADWNIWNQLREAQLRGELNREELLNALTITAATVWQFHDRGRIEAGARADLVIRKAGEDIFSTRPEQILLVMHGGQIRLVDESLSYILHERAIRENYSMTEIGGTFKLVMGDLPGLMNEIRNHYPAVQFPFANVATQNLVS